MRKKAREEAFKLLYALEMGEKVPEDFKEKIENNEIFSLEEKKFCFKLIRGVYDNISKLDKKLENYTLKSNWPFSRLSIIDKNILRLSLFEMLHMEDVPLKVSINEAVNIAKKYSIEDSSKFINGVLGELVRQEKFGNKTI